MDSTVGGTITTANDAKSPCVLIVDDKPANVALLDRLVRSAGISNVYGVTDSREAVQRCLDIDADLVLLDLHMPHIDGFGVLSRLRAALPAGSFVPVLVLTADSTPAIRDRALLEGANDFITKPLDRTEVILRVRNLLETRSLYVAVQRHNAELQAEMERRSENERRVEAERRQKNQRIDTALSYDAINLVFQPIVDLHTGEVRGAEALSRFELEPRRPPNEWFDEATEIGRGADLEITAARIALSHLNRLPADAFLAVNISPATAVRPEWAELLAGVAADRVVLELTEHTRIEDYETLREALAWMRDMGTRVAVDDTGAGYAGLQHILLLQPDIIKLDIDLTRGIERDTAKRALTTALVAFATETRAVIVAEGIETADELDTLRTLGIRWGQGYHLARPDVLPLPSQLLHVLMRPGPHRSDDDHAVTRPPGGDSRTGG